VYTLSLSRDSLRGREVRAIGAVGGVELGSSAMIGELDVQLMDLVILDPEVLWINTVQGNWMC
jgi:hypothetical protein